MLPIGKEETTARSSDCNGSSSPAIYAPTAMLGRDFSCCRTCRLCAPFRKPHPYTDCGLCGLFAAALGWFGSVGQSDAPLGPHTSGRNPRRPSPGQPTSREPSSGRTKCNYLPRSREYLCGIFTSCQAFVVGSNLTTDEQEKYRSRVIDTMRDNNHAPWLLSFFAATDASSRLSALVTGHYQQNEGDTVVHNSTTMTRSGTMEKQLPSYRGRCAT